MKIAVCIKQVPASDQIKMDPDTNHLVRENAEMTVNPADLNALTEAINWKNQCGGTIDVFTMGTEEAKSVLYSALAMGADEAFLITDRAFAGGDSLGTAKVLKSAIEQTGSYDLIVCGSLASDGATGQVGPMLAQLLKIPSVTEVRKILGYHEQTLSVYKSWKGKLALLDMKLPGLLTVSLGCNTVLLPTLRNQMKAKKKTIHMITNQDLNLDRTEIGLSGAKSLVNTTYLKGQSGKYSEMISGSPEEAAEKILKILAEVKK